MEFAAMLYFPSRPADLLRRFVFTLVALLALFAACGAPAGAQVSFSGAYTTLSLSTSLNSPENIAVDTSGNIYIADNGSGYLYKAVPQSGGGYQVSTLEGGLSDLRGVAVDASLNVYYVQTGTQTVSMLPWNGTSYDSPVVVASGASNGLNPPVTVAVDGVGNVYIPDPNNSRILVETPNSSGGFTQDTLTLDGSNNQLPYAVAVNISGASINYAYSSQNGSVGSVYINIGGVWSSYSGFNFYQAGGITALAMDSNNNVYVVDNGNNQVVKIIPGLIGTAGMTVVAALNNPMGVAVDASNNLYISDSGNNQILEVPYSILSNPNSFGSSPVGSKDAQQLTLNFYFSGAETGVSPSVLTQGVAGLDFADAGTGTCTTNGSSYFYFSGDSCTVVVNFTPAAPGLRMGAVELQNTTSGVLATAYINGTGSGSLAAFSPGTASVPVSSSTVFGSATLAGPWGVAADSAGNLFIADQGHTRVVEYSAAGTASVVIDTSTSISGQTLSSVPGVAVDGAGNVYVSDALHNRVVKVPPAGAASATVVNTIGYALNTPVGIAVDGAGDLFIVDQKNNRVVEVTPAGVTSTVSYTLSGPQGVAVDGAGNVYIADGGNKRVLKVGSNGAASVVSTGSYTLGTPWGVATDAAGNLYIADVDNKQVLEVTASGAASVLIESTTSIGGQTLSKPTGMAVDGSGNVYIADSASNLRVVKLAQGTAVPLSFASTTVGSSSTDSPQSVTLENIGNAALSFSSLSVTGTNAGSFTLDSGTSCVTATPLSVGASCAITVDFIPQADGTPLSGAVTLADNSTPSPQTISLSGTGTGFVVLPSNTTLPSAAVGAAYSQTFTALGGTPPYKYSLSNITLPAGLSFSIDGTLSGATTVTGAFSPVGSYLVTVTATDSSSPARTATQYYSLPISKGTPTITWSPASSIVYGGPLATILNATASVLGTTLPGSFAYAATPAGGSSSPISSATVLTPGTYSLTAAFTPNDTNDYNSNDTATAGLAVTPATPGVSVTSFIIPYGRATTTLTASVSYTGWGVAPTGAVSITVDGNSAGTVNCTGTSSPLTCTVSYTTSTLTAGSHSIIASIAADTNYSIAAGTGTLAVQSSTTSFNSVAVGSSQTATITFVIPLGGTISAPVVLTQGATGLDFTDNLTGTCTTQGTSHSYAADATCTVVVKFKPQAPGMRMGAVQLSNSSGVFATDYIYGTGTGPLAAFSPGTPSVLSTTGLSTPLQSPYGVAVDAAGNVYIADNSNNRVVKVTAAGAASVLSTPGYTLNSPMGVAVDGAGDVYIAEYGNNRVLEVTAAGAASVLSVGSYSPLYHPEGVAVDGAGDVYVADTWNSRVLQVTAAGAVSVLNMGSYPAYSPTGVAVDAAGDVYVADYGNRRVVEVTAAGAASVVGMGNYGENEDPKGVAVDSAGDVYIADAGDGRVLEVTAAGVPRVLDVGSYSQDVPASVAVDGAGNVYFADAQNRHVVKVAQGTPAALSFANTDVLSTSSDSTQSVMLQNIGNGSTTLNVTKLAVATTGQTTSSFTTMTSTGYCTSSTALGMGSSCVIGVNFAPLTAGSLAGTVSVTDNSTASSKQTISLSGTGLAPTSITVTPATAAVFAGGTQQYTATANFADGSTEVVTSLATWASSVPSVATIAASGLATGVAAGTTSITASIGGVTSNSATLKVGSTTPANIALAGTSAKAQSAYVTKAFSKPLALVVTDALGLPIGGVTVTLAAPSTGASAVFSNSTASIAATTDSTGTASVTATANATAGSYSVTATAGSLSYTFTLTNSVPNLVVTTAADDAGKAGNCTAQASATKGTDASCSLRDALLEAASLGSGTIGFDSTKFAKAQTIGLTSGVLALPTLTTVTGPVNSTGAPLVTLNGTGNSQIFTVAASVKGATLANLILYDGSSIAANGGAIQNLGVLTIQNSTLDTNGTLQSASTNCKGGAIYNSGTLTINGSTLSNNFVDCAAGSSGGAIYNDAGGSLWISASTFYKNSANTSGGAVYSASNITVIDSTFTGNSFHGYSTGQGLGAALALYGSSTANIYQTTITGNTSGSGGGALYFGANATITLDNSIAMGNVNYLNAGDDVENSGTLQASTGNLIGTYNGTTRTSGSIGLSPLGNYGGQTQTMMPLLASPAFCAGNVPSILGEIVTDQRGNPRTTNNGTCVDAGAVQTNYSVEFAQQPSNTTIYAAMSPAPTVQLYDNSKALSLSGIGVSIFDTALSTSCGSFRADTASTGLATFSSVCFANAKTSDTLVASISEEDGFTDTAASNSFAIAKYTPLISWNPAASITYGTTLSGVMTATANNGEDTLMGTFSYTATPTGGKASTVTGTTVLTVGSYTLTATFTPTDNTDYALGATKSVTLTVTQATSTISAWPTASSITYGQKLANSTLTGGTASTKGTFAWNPSSTIPPVGTASYPVVFTPADSTGYTTVPGTVSVKTAQATPTVTVNPVIVSQGTASALAYVSIAYTGPAAPTGAVSYTVDNVAAVIVPGALPCAPLTGTVCNDVLISTSSLAAGSHKITATIAADANYTTASNSATLAVEPAPVSLGSVAIGSSNTATLTLVIPSAGAIGATVVLTQGAAGKDFTDAGTGTCTTNGTSHSYAAGATCTVVVSFKPQYPGMRMGAVQLSNNDIGVFATVYLSGTGTGPLAAFSPGTASLALASSTSINGETLFEPIGVAVDGVGSVYVVDGDNNRVVKVTAQGAARVLSTGSYTLSLDTECGSDVAVDGAGTVYIADSAHNRVVKVTAAGAASVLTTGSYALRCPAGLAVDGVGNVYIADNTRVVKVTAAGAASVLIDNSTSIGGKTVNGPAGVAVDDAGNVYVTDWSNNRVVKVTAAGVASVLSTGSYTLGVPWGLAVDGAGDVYIADQNNGRVVEVTAAGVAGLLNTGSYSLFNPEGIAVDGAGNVYVADFAANEVVMVAQGAPAALSFANTTKIGSTSADSPQSVTLQNIGNAALDVTKLTTSTAGATTSSFTLASGTSCTASTALSAGQSCAIGVNFEPQVAGSLNGAAILTDNNLNVASSTQAIALKGTGTIGTPTVTVSAASIAYGTATTTLTAKIGYGGVAPTGAVSLKVDSGTAVTATCTGTLSPLTCTASYTTSALALGSHTIAAALAADANYNSASNTGTLTVTQATPTVTVSPVAIVYGTASTKLTASIAYAGIAAPTGAVTLKVDSGSAVTATCTGTSSPRSCTATYTTSSLAAGSHTITASILADANYLAAKNTGTLTVNKATPTVTVSAATIVYGAASETLTAKIAYTGPTAPSGAVSFAVDSGTAVTATCTGTSSPRTCTATYTTSALTGGSHTIAASILTDANYLAAKNTGTLTVNKAAPTVTVSAASIVYGTASETLTAKIAYTGPAAPSGAVTLKVDSGTAVTATCTGTSSPRTCSASYATSTLAVSSHTITAVIAADTNYLTASNTGTLTVLPLVSTKSVGSDAVGSGATATVTFTISSGGTVGAPVVLTQGATGKDFTDAGTGTCTSNGTSHVYSAGATCTVVVKFAPLYPGLRMGAVQLTNSSGAVFATVYLSATGSGPLAAFLPGTASVLADSSKDIGSVPLGGTWGMAVDGAGDVYIDDQSNSRVVKVTAAGVASVVIDGSTSVNGAVLHSNAGVAVDNAGNVFIADVLNNRVVKVTAAGAASVLGTGSYSLNTPVGIAVDGAGDVYIGDQGNKRVVKVTAAGAASVLSTGTYTLSGPQGVTVDGAGNVYIADGGHDRVVKVASNGTASVVTTGSYTLGVPWGLAVDGAGDLYIADATNLHVLEVTAAGTTIVPLSNNMAANGVSPNRPSGLALDGAGDLFIGDPANHRVLKLTQGSTSPLIFATTAVGSTSSDSPKGVSLQNIGNAALDVTGLAAATTGQTATSFTHVSAGCTTSTVLSAGASCTIAVNFTPQDAASLKGTFTVTDNSLNVATSKQTIALGGTGTLGTPTVTVSAASIAYGTATTTLTAKIGYGGVAPTGKVTLKVDSGTAVTAACTGTSSPLTCTAPYTTSALALGSHTIAAALAADANYNSAGNTGTLTVNKATPTVTVTPVTITYGTATTKLTASIAYAGLTAPTGAVTLKVDSGTAVTATCTGTSSPRICTVTYTTSSLAAGSHTITAALAADINYNLASNTGTLTVNKATPTVTVTPAAIAYGTASTTLTAKIAYAGTAAPSGAVSFTVDSGTAVTATCTGTSSPRTCTATYTTSSLTGGSRTVTASILTDTNYLAAKNTGTLTVNKATPTVTVSAASITFGTASATLTAKIAYTGPAAPSGAVSFVVDSGTAVTATCAGTSSPRTCTATYTTSSLAGGSHTITASILTDTNYAAAKGTGTLTVSKATPTVTVTPVTITHGTATTKLTASIAYAGPAAPSGAVSFVVDSGTAVMATCTGTSSPRTCTATYTTSSLTVASHTITASILTDTNYAAAKGTGTLTVK
jgi:streptogramin lyase